MAESGDNKGLEQEGRTGEFEFRRKAIQRGADEFVDDAGPADAPATDPLPVNRDYYPEPQKFRAELKRAAATYDAFAKASAQLINDLRLGRPLKLDPVRGPLGEMIASVIRHPDPMLWMTKLHVPDAYLIGHAQRCCIVSTVLARDIGLPEPQLERIAWGGLLCQIGKTKIPRNLLEQAGPLKPDELERIRQFIPIGVELLEAVPGIDQAVVNIVRCHHERFDGSGYPVGLRGAEIPLLARLVGLVDWYDAMTSLKPYTSNVVSSTAAMDLLHDQRNRQFQDQLVEEFVRAIGLYPTGSLVELNTGEVALVASQNLNHRTQPRVLLVLDRYKRPHKTYERVDLLERNREIDGPPVTIKRALSDGEHDLDPRTIMETAEQQQQAKGWKRLFGG